MEILTCSPRWFRRHAAIVAAAALIAVAGTISFAQDAPPSQDAHPSQDAPPSQDGTATPEAPKGRAQRGLATTFAAANAAYTAGDYPKAIALYDSITAEYLHFESEYNLGNAHFRQGELGLAILHWERALDLKPGDADCEANLALAESRKVDRIEKLPSLGLTDLWTRLTASGLFRTWSWLLLAVWTTACAAFAARLFVTDLPIRRALGTIGGILVGVSVCVALLARSSSIRLESSKEAILIVPSAEVRNSPQTSGSTALFLLHEGTRVTVLQRREGWAEIQLANGNVGWIPAGDCAEI